LVVYVNPPSLHAKEGHFFCNSHLTDVPGISPGKASHISRGSARKQQFFVTDFQTGRIMLTWHSMWGFIMKLRRQVALWEQVVLWQIRH